MLTNVNKFVKYGNLICIKYLLSIYVIVEQQEEIFYGKSSKRCKQR